MRTRGKRGCATWRLVVMGAISACVSVFFAGNAWADAYRVMEALAIDGDTVEVVVELWRGDSMGFYLRAKTRIDGIDTPELHARQECERRAAQEAKRFVERWIEARRGKLTLRTNGQDKYGRILGDLDDGQARLGPALISAGHARAYGGDRRRTWCTDS